MTVEFRFKKAPSYRLAILSRTGAWNEQKLRGQYKTLVDWAKKNHLRVGHWLFLEPNERTFVAAVEVKGKAKGSGRIRVRTHPAATVASVTFDPEVVSPEVVYHGLNDWLKWRKKDKTIKSIGLYREVYSGDPWSSPKVWSKTEIHVVVKK
jgi:effector-binding domain-containing protein